MSVPLFCPHLRALLRAFSFQDEELSLLVWCLRSHLPSLWIFLPRNPSPLETGHPKAVVITGESRAQPANNHQFCSKLLSHMKKNLGTSGILLHKARLFALNDLSVKSLDFLLRFFE